MPAAREDQLQHAREVSGDALARATRAAPERSPVATGAAASGRSIEVPDADVLLRAGFVLVAALAAVHLGVAIAFGADVFFIGVALLGAYAAVLAVASRTARRSDPGRGVALAAIGLLVVAVAMVIFVPGTAGLALLAPVVVLSLASTYQPSTRIDGLAVASWVVGTGAALVLQRTPLVGTLPPAPVLDALAVIHAGVGLGVALFLQWQFSTRLASAMTRITAAHSELVETQDTVKRMNVELRRQVGELELRNREATLVSHLGSLLEVSQTADEAYGVIERAARLLFPGLSGALFVLPPSRQVVDRVATWGHVASARTIYAPEDCWAIRQGRLHIVEGQDAGPRCRHVDDDASWSWMCIPMTAQGSMIGILHLSGDPAPARPGAPAPGSTEPSTDDREEGHLPDAARNLALWIAELLGLSLANFRLRETLQTQSTRDPLTGLFNRRYMEESLERELYRAAREHGTLGTIMLDLDHFKALNDQAGHVAGDAILREIANLLRTHVRAEDIVCRYGGEEFTILLPDAGRDETQARADALRQAVDTMELPNHQRVTISAGVSVYPTNGTTATELVDAADSALYAAKAAGRNRVVAAA